MALPVKTGGRTSPVSTRTTAAPSAAVTRSQNARIGSDGRRSSASIERSPVGFTIGRGDPCVQCIVTLAAIQYADGVEIDHVEAFLAIVRAGGFTRAAATLHLSQPAISRRIHLLERELGAPLFERLGSGLLLTDAGRAFRPHAEALAAGMRDALAAVAAVRGEDSGTVTLAVVGTLASSALTERLRRFREAHAGVDVRIRTALSTEVSALVRRGDAALGLRYGMDADPELVSQVVFDEPMVAVCSSRHPLARRR